MTDGRPRIVFAGGGHASLHSLVNTKEIVDQGIEVVLIAPERYHYYSGMTPGLISHIYEPRQTRIDVQYLVERGGGSIVKDRVVRIDHANGRVILQSGDSYWYDALATNLGSYVTLDKFDEASRQHARTADNIFSVKPVVNLMMLHKKLAGYTAGDRPTIVVVGGAVGGVELAANTKVYLNRRGVPARVVLINKHGRLLSDFPEKGGRLAEAYLRKIGVEILHNTYLSRFDDRVAVTGDGAEIPFDVMEISTGFSAPQTYERSGLATGPDGSLWVNDRLQSITDQRIFGGGDTIAFKGAPLKRVGIYAVRQGPFVYENLVASVKGEPLKTFKPQQLLLYIVNMGGGYGLLMWGKVIFLNKLAWKIKNGIDLRFIKPLQYPGMSTDALIEYLPRVSADEEHVIALDETVEDELVYEKRL